MRGVVLHTGPCMDRNRLIAFGLLVASLGVADRTLHHLAPISLSTVGHRDSANAALYGWGFNPGERIHMRDPDTGEVFIAPANNHGWRDLDREVAKPEGVFRILALGDSNTFGVLVPADETWTRVLERRLAAAGSRAEVLNISYPQWGTDQELEALRLEGVRYRPDLVVVQFTINDLTDIADVVQQDPIRKPFFYRLDASGAPKRHENPAFRPSSARDPLHALAAQSELLKRSYLAATNIARLTSSQYLATEQSVDQLKIVLGLAGDDPLLRRLDERIGKRLSASALDALIQETGRSANRDAILRILENQPFKRFWLSLQYDPPALDTQREDWRLLLSLLREMQKTTASIGAGMAILSDHEEGLYDWERYWLRIVPGDAGKRRFLAPTYALRDFAAEHGIGFIANREKHARARNDSHPNRDGTRAMAANVYAYLMEHYRDRLPAARR